MIDEGHTTWITTCSSLLPGRITMEFYSTAAKFYNVF